METYTPSYQENLLDEVDYSLVQASTGKRIANWLIDLVFFYFMVFAAAFVYVLITKDTDDLNDPGIGERLLVVIIFIIWYSLIEAIFRGKSLGKLITGTRAINDA